MGKIAEKYFNRTRLLQIMFLPSLHRENKYLMLSYLLQVVVTSALNCGGGMRQIHLSSSIELAL